MIRLLVNERILRDFFSPGESVLLSRASQGGHQCVRGAESGQSY